MVTTLFWVEFIYRQSYAEMIFENTKKMMYKTVMIMIMMYDSGKSYKEAEVRTFFFFLINQLFWGILSIQYNAQS